MFLRPVINVMSRKCFQEMKKSTTRQTSETEISGNVINDLKSLSISAKHYILGPRPGSEYNFPSIVINFWCT